jgi:hypothetical protein
VPALELGRLHPHSGRLRDRLESAAAIALFLLFAYLVNRRLLEPGVFSGDALVHQFWMWQFQDPDLFDDPLTAALRDSERYPAGYELLFRLTSVVSGPIVFGEWLGVLLMAFSAWLVFKITRDQASWRPAAWIAAIAFLALVEIHRFYGGFPRAFVHPIVLSTVLLAMRRQDLGASLVAAGGALLYPPAALLAVGVLMASSVHWTHRRPRLDRRRTKFAALSFALFIAAVLVPQIVGGGASRVFTADEARMYPEFGANGTVPFFGSSLVRTLEQNRSGFDLQPVGYLLALAALVLLLLRPANIRLLRREVWALPVVSLAAFGVAYAVLFQLYLPHRYTYPLVAFFAIAVGVCLRPTWAALPRSLVRAPAVAALLSGAALVAGLLAANEDFDRGLNCNGQAATNYLRTLPKDAVIAGNPRALACLPGTVRRPVVISTQLAPSYEKDYFFMARERMFTMLRAYFGPSTEPLEQLERRYGATHLWVRRNEILAEASGRKVQWKARKEPYGVFVRELLRSGRPAVLDLPANCRRWKRGGEEVYDIRCITRGT